MIWKHLKTFTWKEVLGIFLAAVVMTVIQFVFGKDSNGNLTGFQGHLYLTLFFILYCLITMKQYSLTVETGLQESGRSIVVFFDLFSTVYVIFIFLYLFLRPPFLLFYPLIWLQMLGIYLYIVGVLPLPVIPLMKRLDIHQDTPESKRKITASGYAPLLVLFAVGAILLFFSWGFLLFIIAGILGIIAQIFLWRKA